jgi:hypothetical protein
MRILREGVRLRNIRDGRRARKEAAGSREVSGR